MKRLFRLALAVILPILVLAAAGLAWLGRPPARRDPPDVKVERTAERVERGRYLVTHVAACLSCHSQVHADRFSMPVKFGTEGAGSEVDPELGLAAPNLTPDFRTGIGEWTDGEVLRALREGVSRDGHGLFPMMPYPYYRDMSDDDAFAIVAALRSLPPIQRETPKRKLRVPLNFVAKRVPKPLDGPVAGPAPGADPVERGRYLTSIAGCVECHTPRKGGSGAPDRSRDFQGGWELKGPWGHVVTPNITPHPSSFMGVADVNTFVRRFKLLGLGGPEVLPPATRPGFNSPMPWFAYSGMTVEDLTAIYAYLKSLPPADVHHVTFPDAEAADGAAAAGT
jgi:mono/diheme cytochrome c family protein